MSETTTRTFDAAELVEHITALDNAGVIDVTKSTPFVYEGASPEQADLLKFRTNRGSRLVEIRLNGFDLWDVIVYRYKHMGVEVARENTGPMGLNGLDGLGLMIDQTMKR